MLLECKLTHNSYNNEIKSAGTCDIFMTNNAKFAIDYNFDYLNAITFVIVLNTIEIHPINYTCIISLMKLMLNTAYSTFYD